MTSHTPSTSSPVLDTILRGDVVCTTILDSSDHYAHVQAQVARLGARFSNEMTNEVTHLITNRAGSPKHRSACERNARASLAERVLVVRPDWLDACVHAALRVNAEPYLLPPLAGMEICCSGLSPNEKAVVERLAGELGAKYNKVLGGRCTHLLCDNAAGKKFEHALTMENVSIVRPRWIQDCSRMNLLIDERPYYLNLDRGDDDDDDETMSKAQTSVVNGSVLDPRHHQEMRLTASLEKNLDINSNRPIRQPEGIANGNENRIPLESLRVYLTQSAIHDEEKHAPLRMKALRLLARASATLVPELSAALTNFIIALRVPVAASTKAAMKAAVDVGIPVVPLRWLEDSVSQGCVLPVSSYAVPDWETGRQLQTDYAVAGGDIDDSEVVIKSNTFKGIRISLGALWLRDDKGMKHVRRQLMEGHANVLAHDTQGHAVAGVPTHIVCASDIQSRERGILEKAREENEHVVAVTPFWVDSCEAIGRILSVQMCVLFAPLTFRVPIRRMLDMRVSVTISGFQRKDESDWNRRREVLSRLTELMGARYSEKMRRIGTTHLVADDRAKSSEKAAKAKEWGINVVTHEWLLACARTGKVGDVNAYELKKREDVEDVMMGDGDDITPRRSSRIHKQSDSKKKRSLRDTETISLFQKLQEGLDDQGVKQTQALINDGDRRRRIHMHDDDDQVEPFMRRSSRSNSRDAVGAGAAAAAQAAGVGLAAIPGMPSGNSEWSIEASQSQVIVHRDLTPPPTPRKGGRQVMTRSAKRARLNE